MALIQELSFLSQAVTSLLQSEFMCGGIEDWEAIEHESLKWLDVFEVSVASDTWDPHSDVKAIQLFICISWSQGKGK